MSYGVYANLEAIEESINGEKVHNFKRKSRQILLTNDSSSYDLEYKFNASEEYATLKPAETVSMFVHIRSLHLRSTNTINYRIWVYG